MKKHMPAGVSLIITYLAIWLTIVAFDCIVNLHDYMYPRLSEDTIVIFIVVFVASVAIPVAITIWLIDLRKEEKRFWGLRITLIVVSTVISILFTFGGIFIGFVESYTDNVNNYGKVEKRNEGIWEKAESFFPKTLDLEQMEEVSYSYNVRHVLFDDAYYFDLRCIYEKEEDYLSEKARIESLVGKCLIKTDEGYAYTEKYYDGYLEYNDNKKAIHYFFGKDTFHDLPLKKEKLGIDLW